MVARYGAKKDANHKDIVDAIEKAGAFVRDLSRVGGGVPDLLVWAADAWRLVEIKNPETGYGRRGLNKVQHAWAGDWRGGPVFIVRSVDEAVALARGKFDQLERVGGSK